MLQLLNNRFINKLKRGKKIKTQDSPTALLKAEGL